MASISRPSLFSFPQLFGLLVVLGGSEPKPEPKTNVLIRCSNPTKQEKEKKKKRKERKKNPRNKEKASHWSQSILFAFPINQTVQIYIFLGFFFFFSIFYFAESETPTSQNQKRTLKTHKKQNPDLLFLFFWSVLNPSIVHSSGFVPEMVAFLCF